MGHQDGTEAAERRRLSVAFLFSRGREVQNDKRQLSLSDERTDGIFAYHCIVIDVWARVILAGIDLGFSFEVRMVVASIDTYLKHAGPIGLFRGI
jgi:hypothetical protein